MTVSPQWPQRTRILELISDWLVAARWFPAASVAGARVIHYAPIGDDERFRILVAELDSGTQIHIPLAWLPRAEAAEVLTEVADGGVIVDALTQSEFLRLWVREARAAGTLAPLPNQDADALARDLETALEAARPLGAEQSNTSILLPGPRPAILKVFRVLVAGDHPEISVPIALARSGFTAVPEPLGYSAMMITGADVEAQLTCTAVLSALVPDAEDGFDRFVALAGTNDDATGLARALGATTRDLHDHLLASLGEGEPMSGAGLAQRIHTEARQAMAHSARLREDTATLERLDALAGLLQGLGGLPASQRVHGDYHLGQCLCAGGSWFVLDFEGEPLRPLAERILPDQRLRDVAGIVRSIDYARAVAGGESAWCRNTQEAFLDGYFGDAGPSDAERLLLAAFTIEKALYEIRYEALQRPHWEHIPYEALVGELTAVL